jgi:N-acyl-D-aspartate/D-glutamate deacylase
MLDVLITDGEVYDGTGAAPVRADVGIAGDRVARIGPPGAAGPGEAAFIINAAGKAGHMGSPGSSAGLSPTAANLPRSRLFSPSDSLI